jgi:carbon-monoxide dehydrogenase large subunit
VQYVELGCKNDGTLTGLRVHLVGDAGAYPTVGAFLPGGTRRMAHGTYDFDTIVFDLAVATTNTTPMGAYRGAGRPEATALVERAVDQAALTLGIDPIEIRRRNVLGNDVFPFTTLTGNTYDSGKYLLPLERAAEAVGYDRLRAEQAERRQRGDRSLLGVGVAAYVEITAGGGADEFGAVEVHGDGSATVYAGTSAHGQGHQTAYAMLVSDQTGIPIDRITLVDGDTDLVRTGGGTGGSRSLQLGGSAVRGATEAMIESAMELAARTLEADVADIVVDTAAGTVGVAGVPAQAMTWAELAERAAAEGSSLDGEFDFTQDGATFPFGAHIAVVEVDADTGKVRVHEETVVFLCGQAILARSTLQMPAAIGLADQSRLPEAGDKFAAIGSDGDQRFQFHHCESRREGRTITVHRPRNVTGHALSNGRHPQTAAYCLASLWRASRQPLWRYLH